MEIALQLQRMVCYNGRDRDHQKIGNMPYARFVARFYWRHPQVHVRPTGRGHMVELHLVPAENVLQASPDTAIGLDHIIPEVLVGNPV